MIEEGYVLALNKENKVNQLSPAQIKDVFDEEITNWEELGGENLPIRVFRLEDITRYYTEEELGDAYQHAGACITKLVEKTPGIVAFVPQQFITEPEQVHFIKDNTISVKDVFAGAEWFPTATPAPLFGFLPLITGTLWVSLFAILIALPFGLSVSIYMSEIAGSKVRKWLKPEWYTIGGVRVLRADCNSAAYTEGVRSPGGRERVGRKHCAGYHGIAYHYYRYGRRHA